MGEKMLMAEPSDEVRRRKQEIRQQARALRDRQVDIEHVSRQILERLTAQPEYARARTVMSYLDFRSEVRTRPLFPRAREEGKRVVVPYCVGDRLELFRLDSLDELCPGAMGILEPKPELRQDPDRRIDVSELDLVITPGLAFDPQCGRIGYGRGYYDRLLKDASASTAIVAVAFQCQIFPEVPMLPHDVRVHKVITEEKIYSCR
jgi:5-formyltetrahydrofolate cyclo-ligase